MNILGRITARWLVGLFAVLTVLSHASDAGRTARSGFDLVHASLSSGELVQPTLASAAPQGEIRFRAPDKQPLAGGKSVDDAVLSAATPAVPSGGSATPPVAHATTHVGNAVFVPGQRAPPAVFPKA